MRRDEARLAMMAAVAGGVLLLFVGLLITTEREGDVSSTAAGSTPDQYLESTEDSTELQPGSSITEADQQTLVVAAHTAAAEEAADSAAESAISAEASADAAAASAEVAVAAAEAAQRVVAPAVPADTSPTTSPTASSTTSSIPSSTTTSTASSIRPSTSTETSVQQPTSTPSSTQPQTVAAPVTSGPAPSATPTAVGSTTTYAQIVAAAPKEYIFEVPNEYLGEYLRQNPDVSWWRQDHQAKTITALGEPKITGKQVAIVPSGGNDTALITQAAKEAGPGGAVVGNGKPFRVSSLITSKGVTYKNMPMIPVSSSDSQMVKVTTPDVTFINSPIDMLGREVTNGFYVYDNGDRFTMVGGGVANQINRVGKHGSAMVRILSLIHI